MKKLAVLVCALTFVPWASAEAYIGPGLGAGSVAVVLGILASVVMALVALVWYPMKRLAKRMKSPTADASTEDRSKLS